MATQQSRAQQVLAEVVQSFEQNFTVDVDDDARELFSELGWQATERLRTEGLDYDDAALQSVEWRMRWLLTTATLLSAEGVWTLDIDALVRAAPEQFAPPQLRGEMLRRIIDGLCPGFWPFC